MKPAKIKLSKRQKDILRRRARGDLNKEIAARFGITERTVESHIQRILQRLKVRSIIEAIGKLSNFAL